MQLVERIARAKILERLLFLFSYVPASVSKHPVDSKAERGCWHPPVAGNVTE
jgi:hypothetical protein